MREREVETPTKADETSRAHAPEEAEIEGLSDGASRFEIPGVIPGAEVPPISPQQSASPPKKRAKGLRKKAKETVFQTIRKRPKKRIETAEEAITIWKAFRLYGLKSERIYPPGNETRVRRVGDPVEVQVAAVVEGTEGFADWRAGRLSGDDFLEALRPEFPRVFLLPWEGLCGAEEEELQRAMAEPKLEEDGDGRLLPGFRRAE